MFFNIKTNQITSTVVILIITGVTVWTIVNQDLDFTSNNHDQGYGYSVKDDEVKSANKDNNFDITFTPGNFELKSSKNAKSYALKYEVNSVEVNDDDLNISSNPKYIADNNKLSEIHNEHLTINYTNGKKGLRQDFVINDGPTKDVTFKVNLDIETDLQPYQIDEFSIGLKSTTNSAIDIKYKDLLVYDAKGKFLKCKMVLNEDDGEYQVDLIASADEVVYPITIDPLSTSNTGYESTIDSTYTGYAVTGDVDINNDGYADAVVGSYGYNKNNVKFVGKADVFYGSALGIDMTGSPDFTLEGDTIIKRPGHVGLAIGPKFGFSLDGAGDINGDGFDDVIIGAPSTSMIDTTGGGSDTLRQAGAFYIYYGSLLGLTTIGADTIYGNQDTLLFGDKVAGLGDIDGDGFDDVMVSGPGHNNNTGVVRVFKGSLTGIVIPSAVSFFGSSPQEKFGTALAGPGDINNDGLNDILIGAHNFTMGTDTAIGRVKLFLGNAGMISTTPAWQKIGQHKNAQFGFAVSGAGNFDGIGNNDVLIGSNQFNPNYAVPMADTLPDYGRGKGVGAVFVFSGNNTGLSNTPTTVIVNDVGASGFGSSVSHAGDVDGDNLDDIIVGAPFYSKVGGNEGAVYGYYGTNFTNTLDTTFDWCATGEKTNAFLGSSIDKFGGKDLPLQVIKDTTGVILGAYGYGPVDTLYYGAAFIYKQANCGLVKYKEPTFLTFIPDTIVVEAGFGMCGANVPFPYPEVGANCAYTLTITTGIDSSGLFPIGFNTVNFRIVSDGQTVDSSFVIKVEDTQSPTLTNCPETVLIQLPPGQDQTNITWADPTFADNHTCSGGVFTVSQINGVTKNTQQPVGVYPMVYEAVDSSGNKAYCTFRVIVSKTSLDGKDCNFKSIEDSITIAKTVLSEANVEVADRLSNHIGFNNSNFGVKLLLSLFEGASGITLPSWIKTALGEVGSGINLAFVQIQFSFLPSLDVEYGAYYELRESSPLKATVDYAGNVCSLKSPDKLYGCRDTINFSSSFMVDPAQAFLRVNPGGLNQVFGVFIRDFTFKWEIYIKVSACIGVPLCIPFVGCAGCLGYTASWESPHVNVFDPIVLLPNPGVRVDLISVCDESFEPGAGIFTVLDCLGLGGGGDDFVKSFLTNIGGTQLPNNIPVDPFYYDQPKDEFVFDPNRLPSIGGKIPEMNLRFGRLTQNEMGPTFVNGTKLTTAGTEKNLIAATLDIFSLLYYAIPEPTKKALVCSGIAITTKSIDIHTSHAIEPDPMGGCKVKTLALLPLIAVDVLDINMIVRSEYNVNYSYDPTIKVDSIDLGQATYWERPAVNQSGNSQFIQGVGMDETIRLVVPDGQTEPYFINNVFSAAGKFVGTESKTQKFDIGLNVLEFRPSIIIPTGFGPLIQFGPYNLLSLGTKNIRLYNDDLVIPKFGTSITMTPDDIPPVVFCRDTTVILDAEGIAFLDPNSVFDSIASYDLPIGGSGVLNIIDVFPDTIYCDDYPSTTGYLVIEDDNCNFDTCEFTVTVLDTIIPQMGCVDIVVGIGEQGTYILNPDEIAIGVTDNCRTVTVTATPDTFYCADVGFAREVTITAVDIAGNTNFCTATVTVVDTMDLLLECPFLLNYPVYRNTRPGFCYYTADAVEFRPNLIAPDCNTTITYELTGATVGSGSSNVSGVNFNLGATTITYTATDENGNSTSCSFIVIVEDNEPPIITCPATDSISTNYDLANDYNCTTDYTWNHPTPVDNCTSITSYEVTYTNPDGTTENEDLTARLTANDLSQTRNFSLGTTTIEYVAVDTMGNEVSCLFTITVVDDELPTLFCQEVISCQEYTYSSDNAIRPNDVTTFTLNVPNDINVTDLDITLVGTSANIGQLSFNLVSPSGTNVPLFASLCNNTTTFNVTLDDEAATSINTAPCSPLGNGGSYFTLNPLSAFNGESSLGGWQLIVTNNNAVSCGTLDEFTLNICGNSVNANLVTTVSILTDDNSCDFTVVSNEYDPEFTDNCNNVVIAHDYIFAPNTNTLVGAVLPLGETTVIWTVTDDSGNTIQCTIIYIVKDQSIPEFINCPENDVIQDAEPGTCGANVNFALPIAFDDCDGQIVVQQTDNTGLFSGSVFPVGMTILEYLATDVSGNTTSCTVRVIVNDTQNGSFACPQNISVGNDNWLCSAIVNGIQSTSVVDNCTNNASVTYQIEYPAGSATIVGGGVANASGDNFLEGTSIVTYKMASQPTLLITEVTQDIDAPIGGMNPVPYTVSTNDDYVELTNLGPAAYNISGLIIERFGLGFSDVFEVPNVTILNPGETLVLHYGNGNDDIPNHFFNLPCAVDITSGQQAGYLISFKNRVIDVVTTNGYSPFGNSATASITPLEWSGTTGNSTNTGGVIRKFSFDNHRGNDWVVVSNCYPLTIGEVNPDLETYTWNGTTTALQSIMPQMQTCQFTVTVNDVEAPFCGEIAGVNTYTGGSISGGYDSCNEGTINVPSTNDCIISDLNVSISGNFFGVDSIFVTLTSPSGETISLLNRPCPPSTDNTVNVNLTFDDQSNNLVTSLCGNASWTGTVKPQTPLLDFYSEKSAGNWTLNVGGHGNSDSRVNITSWSINPTCLTTFQMDDVVISNEAGICGSQFSWIHPYFLDNCTDGSIVISYSTLDADCVPVGDTLDVFGGQAVTQFFCVGTTTVTYTLVDAEGNTQQCGFDITVEDNEDPLLFALSCKDYFINLEPSECERRVFFPSSIPTLGSDNCEIVSVSYSPASGSYFPIGTTIVVLTVTDAAGNITTCEFEVVVEEYLPTSSVFACNDLINLSLDENCTAIINPDMILESNEYRCYDNYCITITTLSGTPHPNSFDLTDVGQTFIVSISDCLGNGNSCWGYVKIEDKLIPLIECPDDVTVFCGADTSPDSTGYALLRSCELFATINYQDNVESFGLCNDPRSIISRKWLVSDDQGNTATCIQTITIAPITLNNIVWPEDYEVENALECSDVKHNPLLTTPEYTGYPTIEGYHLKLGNYCMISVIHEDEIFPLCQGSYVIARTWKILNACLPFSDTNPRIHTQAIKVFDTSAPYIYPCPKDTVVVTSPWACYADEVELSVPYTLKDACSDYQLSAIIYGGGSIQVTGQDLHDTLRITAFNLSKGNHIVKYTLTDACLNAATCSYIVTVIDGTAPVPVAKQNVVLSLTGSGTDSIGGAKLYANSIDNGSYDNCSDVRLEVRRVDGGSCENIGINGHNNNLTFNNDTQASPDLRWSHPSDDADDTDNGDYVKFCCEDIPAGESFAIHQVILRVWDDGNMNGFYGDNLEINGMRDNYNETWTDVRVENKLPPTLVCPDNVTISCDTDFGLNTAWTLQDTSNLVTGNAQAFDLCIGIKVEYRDVATWNNTCQNTGRVRREFRAIKGDKIVSCYQTITIEPLASIFTVTPPTNSVVETVCNFNASLIKESEKPRVVSGPCDVIGEEIDIDTFFFEDGVCKKWRVTYNYLNWCTNEQKGPFTKYYTFKDDIKPIVNCQDQMFAANPNPLNPNGTCSGTVALTASAIDEGGCIDNGWIKWEVLIDLWGNGSYDLEFNSFLPTTDNNLNNDTNANGINDRYVSPTANGGNINLPTFSIDAELSTHKVLWKAFDGCGNVSQCLSSFMVTDKKAPTPYCISIATALMDNGQVELWASDFNAGSFDNCTSSDDLMFTFNGTSPVISKLNEEHYFKEGGIESNIAEYNAGNAQKWNPVALSSAMIFNCDDVPLVQLELTVWDNNLNSDYCTVSLSIVDNNGACGTGSRVNIGGNTSTPGGIVKPNVIVSLQSDIPNYPKYQSSTDSGNYMFTNHPMAINYKLSAYSNENWRTNVSTLDLVLMQRHILGIQKLDSPFKLLAADVNNDNFVKVSDMVMLRKLILGLIDKLPSNNSWIGINADHVFSDEERPWHDSVSISLPALYADIDTADFMIIKIGDVNDVFQQTSQNRSMPVHLYYKKSVVKDGRYKYDFYTKEQINLHGIQFSLKGKDIEIERGIIPIFTDDYNLTASGIDVAQYMDKMINVVDHEVLFSIIMEEGDLMLNNNLEAEIYLLDEPTAQRFTLVNDADQSIESVLWQNEPNPFRTNTSVDFYLATDGEVSFNVSDITGKIIKEKTEWLTKGSHSFELTNRDFNIQSGIYLLSMKINNQLIGVKRMILVD